MPRILIATDAWLPQTNGVVTTYTNIVKILEEKGYETKILSHQDYAYKIDCPLYKEIDLVIDRWKTKNIISDFDPDYVHIATPESPIGSSVRKYCNKKLISYTTAYHTKLPEYVNNLTRGIVPKFIVYKILKKAHDNSKYILVPSKAIKKELENIGFKNVVLHNRGINRNYFNTNQQIDYFESFPRPILLYVGRVSVEKNITAFLDMPIYGSKIIVGDGPIRKKLERKYIGGNVHFMGYKYGEELGEIYKSSSVLVFPSKTDTFGIVMIEAISCGTPIASYNVTGPDEIVRNGVNGYMTKDLRCGVEKALNLDRDKVYKSSLKWSWESSTELLLKYVIGGNHDNDNIELD